VHYVDFRAIANSPPRISNVTTTDRVKKLLDRISALPNLLDTLEDENVIDLEAELAQWKLGLRAAPTELPTRKRRRDAGTKRSSETRKRKAPRTQGTRSRRKRQRSIPPEMDQFLSTMVLDSAPPVPVDDDIVDVILGTGTVHITPNGIPKGTTILREPPQPITTPMLDPPIANPSWGHALMALPQDLASSREETSRDSFSSDDERFFFYWKDHPDTNNGNDIPTPNTSPEIDHATSHELPQPHHDPPTSLACQSSATANSENTSPPEGRHVGMQDVDTQMAPSRDTTSHIVDNPMAQIPPLARTPHTTETTQPQQLTGPPMRVASEAHTSPAMKASSASSIEYSMEIGVIPTANYTALNNITTPPSDDLGMLSSYSPVNFNPLEYHDPNGGHSEDEPDVDDLFSDIMGQSNELPPLHSHGSMLLDLINTSSAHNNHNNHNACPPTTPPHNDEATSLLSPSFNFVADEISLEVPPICTTSSQGPSSSSSVQHPDQPAFPPPPSSSSATSSATTPWTYFPTTTTTSSQPPPIPTPRVDNSNHTATPTAPVYYYHSPTPFPLPFMNWSAFSPPSQRGNLKTYVSSPLLLQ